MPRNREAPIRANCTVHLRLQSSPPFLFKCLRQAASFCWAWRSHAQPGRRSSQCGDGRASLLLIREAGWTRLVRETSVQTSDVRPLPTTVPTGNGSRSSSASIRQRFSSAFLQTLARLPALHATGNTHDLRSGYATSDYDRTHILSINYF
jgi:hypothetical protein